MASFTDKVKRLERVRQALRRRYGEPTPAACARPVEHAVRVILAEEASAAQVDAAMARLGEHFVDMNDLRVSRPREIRDVLGASFPRAGHKARVIPRLLDQVFKQYNSMEWKFLEGMGKVQARAFFEKLEEVRPFVAAAVARVCVGAHAFPVDNDVARVLGRLGILDPATESEAEMQGLLERAVKADRAAEAHALVRRLGEDLCVVGTPLCAECPLNPICPSAVCPPKGKVRKARVKKREAGGKDAPNAPAAPADPRAARRAAPKRAGAPTRKSQPTARQRKRR